MATRSEQIQRVRRRLKSGDRVPDCTDCRTLIREFSDALRLRRSEYSDSRHLKLLRHGMRLAEDGGHLCEAVDDHDVAEELVRWIHTHYDNENTNRDYRIALRVIGRHVTDGDDVPDALAWIPTGTGSDHDPVPDAADMLDWNDDVLPMIEAARNPRDEALIALQFDAGCRGGELKNLSIGDITDTQHGLRLTVDGSKDTGTRYVGLIPSIPYVQQWLTRHPANGRNDAPLWSKLHAPEPISYTQFLACFRHAAERAGVTKPVTPTNFRKSNAAWLASRGANEALIEDRQGRKRGSGEIARYVGRFAPDNAEAQYAKLHGLDVEQTEPEDLAPATCPRCRQDTPAEKTACVWCGQILDYEADDKHRGQVSEVRQQVLSQMGDDSSTVETLEAVRELTEIFEANPELYEILNQIRVANETN